MREALLKVMEERDDALASMVAAGVWHVHEAEQYRKKIIDLESQIIQLSSSHSGNNNPGESAGQDFKQSYGRFGGDNDAELISLCQQLAAEINAKTSASMEIVRLKELREIERKSENEEKLAMLQEIDQLKKLLCAEKTSKVQALHELDLYRESFIQAVAVSDASDNVEKEVQLDYMKTMGTI
jgi:hypothetical protein